MNMFKELKKLHNRYKDKRCSDVTCYGLNCSVCPLVAYSNIEGTSNEVIAIENVVGRKK